MTDIIGGTLVTPGTGETDIILARALAPGVTPAYDIGDVLYLRESAALGHLEAVRIASIAKNNGEWIYTVNVSAGRPAAMSHFGDRIQGIQGATLYYTENELIVLCDALALAEANAYRQLQLIQSQKDQLCNG